jgi:hypothetical protein
MYKFRRRFAERNIGERIGIENIMVTLRNPLQGLAVLEYHHTNFLSLYGDLAHRLKIRNG